MNDVADFLLWLWIAVHAAPPLIVVGRGILGGQSAGAVAGLVAFFAFVSLLAAGAGGILLYYVHSAVPTWVIGVVLNLLAVMQPIPTSQAPRQENGHAL